MEKKEQVNCCTLHDGVGGKAEVLSLYDGYLGQEGEVLTLHDDV